METAADTATPIYQALLRLMERVEGLEAEARLLRGELDEVYDDEPEPIIAEPLAASCHGCTGGFGCRGFSFLLAGVD